MKFTTISGVSISAGLALLITGCNTDVRIDDNLLKPQVIYVSPNGTGNGKVSSPTNLTEALNTVKRNGTIQLLEGEYPQLSLPLMIQTQNLTIKGEGIGQSILIVDNAVDCQLIDVNASGLTMQQLTIDATDLGLAPDTCEQAALVRVTGDQVQLSELEVLGSNARPAVGTLELPATNAYSLIRLYGSNTQLKIDGLRLNNAPRHAISVQQAQGDVQIEGLEIHNSGYRGITLYQVEGRVRVLANVIDGAVNEGIYLRDVTGEAKVSQNKVSNLFYRPTLEGGSGIEGGIVHTNTHGSVITSIRFNNVDIDPSGQNRYLSSEPLLDIDGIEVNMFGTARGFALVENNIISNTDDDGIDSDTADHAELDIIIRNNDLSAIQDRSISFVATGEGRVRGLIEDNRIAGPSLILENDDVDADGIAIRPRANAQMDVTVRNNSLTNLGRKGIDINMNRGGNDTGPFNHVRVEFLISDNEIYGAGQRGLDIQLEDQAHAIGILENNRITNSQEDGLRVRSGAGDNHSMVQKTSLTVAVRNNHISNSASSGDAGLFARAQRESILCLALADNSSVNQVAELDYFVRSQQDSIIELQGIASAIAASNPSSELRAELLAKGNTGRNADFPVRVQNNSIQVAERCIFVADDFAPELPQLPLP